MKIISQRTTIHPQPGFYSEHLATLARITIANRPAVLRVTLKSFQLPKTSPILPSSLPASHSDLPTWASSLPWPTRLGLTSGPLHLLCPRPDAFPRILLSQCMFLGIPALASTPPPLRSLSCSLCTITPPSLLLSALVLRGGLLPSRGPSLPIEKFKILF